MSRLKSLAKSGSAARFTATLPAAAASVQATLLTGTTPTQHGAIADAFLDRSSGVIKRGCPAESLHSPPLWAPLKHRDPAFTTAIWFSPLAPAANVDCACRIDAAVASPAEGRPAVVTSPQELADALVGCLGPFPSESPDDPHSGMRSLAWIVDSFVQTAYSLKPRFSLVVLSHIERLATKFGPGSPEAQSGLGELDLAIGALVDGFLAAGIRDAVWIVAGEDCFTEVNAVSLPNAALKEAGLLTSSASSGAAALVAGDSRAFALGEGPLAQIYARDAADIERVSSLFAADPAVEEVLVGDQRARIGLNHPLAGDVILRARAAAGFEESSTPEALGTPTRNGGRRSLQQGEGLFVCSRPVEALNALDAEVRDADVAEIIRQFLEESTPVQHGR